MGEKPEQACKNVLPNFTKMGLKAWCCRCFYCGHLVCFKTWLVRPFGSVDMFRQILVSEGFLSDFYNWLHTQTAYRCISNIYWIATMFYQIIMAYLHLIRWSYRGFKQQKEWSPLTNGLFNNNWCVGDVRYISDDVKIFLM